MTIIKDESKLFNAFILEILKEGDYPRSHFKFLQEVFSHEAIFSWLEMWANTTNPGETECSHKSRLINAFATLSALSTKKIPSPDKERELVQIKIDFLEIAKDLPNNLHIPCLATPQPFPPVNIVIADTSTNQKPFGGIVAPLVFGKYSESDSRYSNVLEDDFIRTRKVVERLINADINDGEVDSLMISEEWFPSFTENTCHGGSTALSMATTLMLRRMQKRKPRWFKKNGMRRGKMVGPDWVVCSGSLPLDNQECGKKLVFSDTNQKRLKARAIILGTPTGHGFLLVGSENYGRINPIVQEWFEALECESNHLGVVNSISKEQIVGVYDVNHLDRIISRGLWRLQ